MLPEELRDHIITPTLKKMDLWSRDADRLVLGTGIQESHLIRIKQMNNGPARSFYQMEPDTLEDIYENFLKYRADLKRKLDQFLIPGMSREDNLTGNLWYATAACRMHYYRVPEAIPNSHEGLAIYWKQNYNTIEGKGTVEEFIKNTQNFIG